ncbi:hypothetical protein GGI42DRAFT_325348 [Trichoderma sp. SZMC 28013]
MIRKISKPHGTVSHALLSHQPPRKKMKSYRIVEGGLDTTHTYMYAATRRASCRPVSEDNANNMMPRVISAAAVLDGFPAIHR